MRARRQCHHRGIRPDDHRVVSFLRLPCPRSICSGRRFVVPTPTRHIYNRRMCAWPQQTTLADQISYVLGPTLGSIEVSQVPRQPFRGTWYMTCSYIVRCSCSDRRLFFLIISLKLFSPLSGTIISHHTNLVRCFCFSNKCIRTYWGIALVILLIKSSLYCPTLIFIKTTKGQTRYYSLSDFCRFI